MEEQILSKDGLLLSANFYTCENPIAVVQIIHGMAEHKMRYDSFARKLVQSGFSVLVSDMRGHGKSIISKEHFGYFSDQSGVELLVNDQLVINQFIRRKYPDTPIYMFAHSMGSLIARAYILQHDDTIDKLVLSGAPCYINGSHVALGISKWLTWFYGGKGHHPLIRSFATLTTSKHEKKPNDWLSYNEENVSAYNRDPLCGFSFTNAGYITLYELICKLHHFRDYEIKNPNLEILFLSGQDDPVTGGHIGLTDSINCLKKIGYKQVKNHVFEHMRHEILHETNRAVVMQEVIDFYQTNVNQQLLNA